MFHVTFAVNIKKEHLFFVCVSMYVGAQATARTHLKVRGKRT